MRLPRDLVKRDAARFRQHFGGLDHIGRLVAFAAKRIWREIRRVGFDENAVRRQFGGNGAQRGRVLEGQNARERDEEPERYGAAGKVGAAGETMQHGGEGALPRFFLENASGVVVGLARMDHQRQPGLARRPDVGAKAALLILPRAAVVVVVEPGFADRDHLGMPRVGNQVGRSHVQFLVGVMRMGADRTKHIGEAIRDRQQFMHDGERGSRS